MSFRDYAARGWHVVPCYTVRDGICTCHKGADCPSPAKHPLPKDGGHKAATTDPTILDAWAHQWPDANIAIRTGSESGIVVIDLDSPEALADLEAKFGDLPDTPTVKTAKGWHLYFKHPGVEVRNSARKLAVDTDVRANGGYVIAPPSVHHTGHVYAWVDGLGPDLPLADLPPAILASLSQGLPAAPLSKGSEPSLEYDLDGARERLRKAGHKELVRALKAGDPLAQPGERDNAVNAVASKVAWCTDLPPDGALGLVLGSLLAMETRPEGHDYWITKFKDSFNRARTRAVEQAATAETARKGILAALSAPPPDPKNLPPAEDDPDAWHRALETRVDKDGSVRVLPTAGNVNLILTYAPEWRGVLRMDTLRHKLCVVGGPLPGVSELTFHTEVANWLAWSPDWKLNVPSRIVDEQILAVALRNKFDPLLDYLNGLKWDGVPRLDSALETYFGVAPTPYTRAVSAKWMIAATARAVKPGCQVDNVLILEGTQGARKTSALRVLGGPFFLDEKIVIGQKDSSMLISPSWIVELGELETFRNSEAQAKKAFFTRTVDTYRAPYARVATEHPRHCVFVGTTNEDDYLSDRTGNRRYWPVRCGGAIDVKALERDRDQLWAEALARFYAGETWWLEGDLAALSEEETAERTVTGGESMTEAIADWWLKLPLAKRPADVTIYVVATVLGMPTGQVTKAHELQIGRALRGLGFTKKQIMRDGRRFVAWYPPDALAKARPTHLTPVPNDDAAQD